MYKKSVGAGGAGGAGALAVSCVGEITVTFVAGVPPKLTVGALTKFVPLIVTVFPPAIGPAVGLTLVTVAVSGSTVATTLVGV